MQIKFYAPPLTAEDSLAAETACRILGGIENSRLFTRIRENIREAANRCFPSSRDDEKYILLLRDPLKKE
ncbi:insulinase family protein [Candidatus Woesearchaeota archaeon]|nr:insulinase family protein [Candidatus Woesearchaeota archaeon]